MQNEQNELSRAHESRNAIERLYIEMRHVFNSGAYKINEISGRAINQALLTLSPEIYGSINDQRKVELDGLVYVIERLPKGIETCRFVKFTSQEGFDASSFEVIMPLKRRRNCYHVDETVMYIEVTRGRSELYDAITHLTFLYNEAEKIKNNSFDEDGNKSREWQELEEIINSGVMLNEQNRDRAFTYLSSILGRTYEETKYTYARLDQNAEHNSGLFQIVYHIGRLAAEEAYQDNDREISFTPTLQQKIGRHIYGERWAYVIKKKLFQSRMFERPMHIISANLHSVMNTLYARPAVQDAFENHMSLMDLAMALRKEDNSHLRKRVFKYAEDHGMTYIPDTSGTNLGVQIFDTSKLPLHLLSPELKINQEMIQEQAPVIIVMDYAFGEQAYETMDELLKPHTLKGHQAPMPVASISVMGKAGILGGDKGDIMIPNAHVFEGTADNYPIQNEFHKADFQDTGFSICEGPMITVLGTSLQNRDVLAYFKNSSWRAIGLEMEGAHYQKAIQAHASIRKNISADVVLRYAYYASDNPLVTGSTLASGSLGLIGVKPTYAITLQILNKILGASSQAELEKPVENSEESQFISGDPK